MSRENILELLKNGPPLSFVAEKLMVSRQTLYRNIDLYKQSKDSKMNPTVKEYFDMVVMGKITSDEEARKQLEQLQFIAEGRKELIQQQLQDSFSELHKAQREYRIYSEDMNSKQKVEAQEHIDRLVQDLKDLEEQYGVKCDRTSTSDVNIQWNEGEIRTACYASYSSPRIFIDADFDQCQNITIELIVVISGSDFVMARFAPQTGYRFVDIECISSDLEYKYQVKWVEKDRIRTAGPYKIEFDEDDFF